jgi:NitT/TauT family transport system ATP-binding protein
VNDRLASTATDTGGIAIREVSQIFEIGQGDPVQALQSVSLNIPPGSFVSIVGPSGCGKSTLLKILADLLQPTAGQVSIEGKTPGDLRRDGRIGLVFQQANLMPWLNVAQNITLMRDLVRDRGIPVSDTLDVQELIDVVGLSGFQKKHPHQLSGGMQQRVALARALLLDPALLLMDEPFAALDEITRDRMGFELMRIWQRYQKTVVFITHSLAEAVFLSDQVILMSARPGRIHRIHTIDLPRPRDEEMRLSDAFAQWVGTLHRELYQVMK